jgi:copper chaperone CopZ
MQTEHMTVTGMSCGGCASKVTAALNALAGVQAAQVSLSNGNVTIRYDEKRASAAQLKAAVIDAGYGVNDDTKASQSKGCCCK